MKKQTAANNEFLKEVKRKFNKPTYKEILNTVNEKGMEAGKERLEYILKHV